MKTAYGILIRDQHNNVRHIEELYATPCRAKERRDLELQLTFNNITQPGCVMNLTDEERATILQSEDEICVARIVQFIVPTDFNCIQ